MSVENCTCIETFPSGTIIISKAVHGNLQDIFKQKYIGYTKAEAEELFIKSFQKEEDRTFVNIP